VYTNYPIRELSKILPCKIYKFDVFDMFTLSRNYKKNQYPKTKPKVSSNANV